MLAARELPKDAAKPSAPDYGNMFYEAELWELLLRHVGQPRPFNVFTGPPTDWDRAAQSVIFATVEID
jgi:hypothetical protein